MELLDAAKILIANQEAQTVVLQEIQKQSACCAQILKALRLHQLESGALYRTVLE